MAKTKIVVLGAGYAGVSATRQMSKVLKDTAEITLIDRNTYHTSLTQLHEVAAGRVEPIAVQYDLQKLLGRRKNVELITAEIENVDKEAKVVKTNAGDFPFDYLVVAMGGEPNDFGVPGVKEHGFTLWSTRDAIRLRRHLEIIVEKAAVEPDEVKRRAMLSVVVAGSGFTGIEMIGELVDWKQVLAKHYNIPEEEFTLSVVEMMPTILNTFPRNDADKVFRYLEKKGVNMVMKSAITEVAEDHIKIKDGNDIPTHTLIWTTGVQGNTQAQAFGLEETERGNRLVANKYMQAKGYEDKGIYVAGDINGYIDPVTNRPSPQIVEAAEQTGHVAAHNIVAEIKGGEKEVFVGNYKGTMVSVGSKWGVAVLFDKVHLSGFFAMAMKHITYLIYCLSIRSGYYMWKYLEWEIFHTKDRRNLGHGNFSRLGNVLWAFPLRVFYGVMWLTEASPKIIGDGKWYNPSTWFGSGSWWTDSVVFPFDWLRDATTGATDAASAATGADATSAATGAATGAGDAVWSLSYTYGQSPLPVFSEMPGWVRPFMQFMLPNQEVARFMQRTMSIVEVLIALAIIFGAFTFIASALTAALTVMFSLSGMFFWVNIWFIPVAIALMNGSGRAFGLDFFIQPWIQKHLGKRWYGVSKARYGEK